MQTKSKNDGRLASCDDAEPQDNPACADHMEAELLRMGVGLDDDITRAIRTLKPLWTLLEEKGYYFQEVNCEEDGHSREEDGIRLWYFLKGEGYSVAITPGEEGRVEIEEQGPYLEIGHKLSFRSPEAGTSTRSA
jgi:hypothetical protein